MIVSISLVYPDEVSYTQQSSWSPYLSSDEVSQMSLYNGKRLSDWLAGRVALKKAISIFSNINPNGISVNYLEDGRPYVEGMIGHCSISHSEGFGAGAYAVNTPVGIDVQVSKKRYAGLLSYVITNTEKKLLNRLEILSDITYLWVAKESVMKAEGIGLIDPKKIIVKNIEKDNGVHTLSLKVLDDRFTHTNWLVNVYTLGDLKLALALPNTEYANHSIKFDWDRETNLSPRKKFSHT